MWNIQRYINVSSARYIKPDKPLGSQTAAYDLFKRLLGSGPVYAALGNHDSYNQCVFELALFVIHVELRGMIFRAQDAPHSIGEGLADEFSW